MGIRVLLYLYGRRVRAYPVQEALAGMGIAIGVALAFSVMVATGSVVASAGEALRGVTGSADLQLTARDGRGFDQRLLPRVRRLEGVARAAPLLETRAVLVGPAGDEEPVTLASIDPSLAALSGALTRSFAPGGFELAKGVMLPSAVVDALELPNPDPEGEAVPLPEVGIYVRGRARRATVAAVLGRDTVGSLTEASLAIVPLGHLQHLAGLRGRISRVLVEAEPGQEALARRSLQALARGRLAVSPADTDLRLLEQATSPTNQVTGFFAAISALLGLLLAFNAMLLTAPERRRLVSALRVQGYRPRQVVTIVLFEAGLLGVVASTVGVLVGGALARTVFQESPEYLASGFTLGGRTIVGGLPLVLALCGGIVASCLAAAPPLLDLRRGRAVDAVFRQGGAPGNAVTRSTRVRSLVLAAALVVGATALLAWVPRLALGASGMLAVATLLAIPTVFALVLALLSWTVRHAPQLGSLVVAVMALRATTLRSLALAATGAVAVYGSVAIGGARDDLLRGLGLYADDYVSTADVWVMNPMDNQGTNDFRARDLQRRIEGLRGVRAARRYRGGFLDYDGRRLWVIARPPADEPILPPTQVVRGDLETATRKVREGGWIAISDQVAREHDVRLGEPLALPTPTGPATYRVAATTTNLGWAPGAMIVNGADYVGDWGRSAPTAIEVSLTRSTDPERARAAIETALGPDSGLRVQTAGEHAAQMRASVRQGLRRLGQISMLLLVAAVLAMAAAMGAAIWQRRGGLAALRVQSFSPRQLWGVLMIEAAAVLGAGGLTGAAIGIYGQLGADRYLDVVTGFPVAPVPAGWQTLATFGVVVPTALLIVAIPGWFASRVPPSLGLSTD